ncbi:MAG: dihydroorotate dehydrogenase B (NAD(+)), electron transfer subunit [Phycisphaerae bacterium]
MSENGTSGHRGVYLSHVVANTPLCREHWRLTVQVDFFPDAAPGQFLQVLCSDPFSQDVTPGVFTRRPFSIGGLRRRGEACELDIIHRAVGAGTRWLSRLRPGDPVSILGPLGRPFAILDDRPVAWLVGGGVGLPPLIWLAEALRLAGKRTTAICGARCADLLPLTRRVEVAVSGDEASLAFGEFADSGVPTLVSTDDGSLGAAGRVPDLFARYLDAQAAEQGSAVVYTCGPEPMMKAVARLCMERAIPTQVCLERVMACGMGTCQSCVVRVRDPAAEDQWRYRLCCTDGPVFDARQVLW